MNDDLYPIGDVARRTGLAVSAIRFYSDEGIVPPAEVTAAGHRRYDLRAIARLELIHTLRELGTGLEEIRRLLDGGTTLPALLTEHLELVERQERELRARRAVLRALAKQHDPAARAALMRELVSMSDEERERLIDEFWADVSSVVPADFAARLSAMRPHLPDDPSAAQLQAWIELADLVRDGRFRDAVRSYLHDTFAVGPGPRMTATPVQEFIHSTGEQLMRQIIAAHHSGLPPESPHARELADRLARETAEACGAAVTPELRERMAAGFLVVGERYREALDDPEYDATHGRYLALVAVINGTAAEPEVDFASLGPWLSAALRLTPAVS
ncbi:MerR family transcriptional regulator [Amycolatopsis sp. 195334CR]|uniref:MerR family transcriptional regulator n=1 Tax=Amycolatopsis sp. 195334CR TaxID=2814588 RepID=UPI001A8ED7D1|nr:MerR family transcriptional regulator [Amycolatopsis sp. 195334CR]MBN6038276.1 MerR family transcriptional regulator [Amycolatopsis sp. 195334CR]